MCAVPVILINLMNESLWKTFGDNNEMIVNRRGRNIFPTLGYTVGNLEPAVMYTMSVQMVAMDAFNYRFDNGSWVKQSDATELDPVRVFMHSDGYKSGMEWMANAVDFPSLKIGNDKSSSDMIVLQPHRMYMPQIDVWQLSSDQLTAKVVASYRFEATRFIAVTAYKNKEIAETKKLTNKHAAGKRKRLELPGKENQPEKKCRNAFEDPIASQHHDWTSLAPAEPSAHHQFPSSSCQLELSNSFPAQIPRSSLSQIDNFHCPPFHSNPSVFLQEDPYNAINFFKF